MGMNSVNTNTGAMIALQNLNHTSTDLNQTQNRINTGLKVASAKDNGAIWAIAQNQRADVSAIDSVKDSLQRGQSIVDVAISAAETVSDLLNQMKAKALAATDASLDTAARTALNADYTTLREQIKKTVSNAAFSGANLLKTAAANLVTLADATGTSKLTVVSQVMVLGGGKLQDTMVSGIGNLVDADVAKESATLQALQALQTKQQLGVQALSIANSSSSILLSLFR